MSDGILRKISALLNKTADRGASEEESKAAADKAAAMMLTHQIDMLQVSKYQNEYEGITNRISADAVEIQFDTGKGRTPSWDAYLCYAVAEALGGKAIRHRSYGNKSHGTFEEGKMTVVAVGVTETLVELFTFLRLVATTESASAMANREPEDVYNWRTGGYTKAKRGGRAWRLAWLAGYTDEVAQRLKDVYDEQEKISESSGNALVLAKDLVAEKVAELFPRLGYSNARPRAYNPAAMALGRQAGGNVDIGLAKVGANRPGLGQ